MWIATLDFWAPVHRTVVDIASLALLLIGVARLILHDWEFLKRSAWDAERKSTVKDDSFPSLDENELAELEEVLQNYAEISTRIFKRLEKVKEERKSRERPAPSKIREYGRQ
jgi:hypothetical protein